MVSKVLYIIIPILCLFYDIATRFCSLGMYAFYTLSTFYLPFLFCKCNKGSVVNMIFYVYNICFLVDISTEFPTSRHQVYFMNNQRIRAIFIISNKSNNRCIFNVKLNIMHSNSNIVFFGANYFEHVRTLCELCIIKVFPIFLLSVG